MPRRLERTGRRRSKRTALDLLKADHADAKKLLKQFERFKKSEDGEGMQQCARAVCKALVVHAQIEEEIFYPALRAAADADDALDEADVEHNHIKELVQQIEASQPGDDLFMARVKVLAEYVDHHVKEEETTIFSEARKASVDLAALGEQLATRKEELEASEEAIDVGALAGQGIAKRKRQAQRAMR